MATVASILLCTLLVCAHCTTWWVKETPVGFVINELLNPPLIVRVGEVFTLNWLPNSEIDCPLVVTTNLTTPNIIPPLIVDTQGVRYGFTSALPHVYYWCFERNYGSTIQVLDRLEDCSNQADGAPCDAHNTCSFDNHCFGSFCVGATVYCPPPSPCKVAICTPSNGNCTPIDVADGVACTLNTTDYGLLNGTCSSGNCTVDLPAPYDWHPGLLNMYFVSLFSVGGSILLVGRNTYRKGWRKGFCRLFTIFPMLSLFSSLGIVFLNINLVLFQDYLSTDTVNRIITSWFVLDSPSTIFLQIAYYYRLHVIILAGQGWTIWPLFGAIAKILLIIPLSWPVMDILSILAVWNPKYADMADGKFLLIIYGVWNLSAAVYTIYMHMSFVYLVVHMMSSARKTETRQKLLVLGFLLVLNPFCLLFGSIWSFWDRQLSVTITNAVWVNEVFVFMLLNWAVAKVYRKNVSARQLADSPREPGS